MSGANEVASVPLAYNGMRLAAEITGADGMAAHALTVPGLRGLALFMAARGDAPEDAAGVLGLGIAELEAILVGRELGDGPESRVNP